MQKIVILFCPPTKQNHDSLGSKLGRKKYKRIAIIALLKPGGCVKRSPALVTNQILVFALLFRTEPKRKGNKRGKAKTTKAKFPTKIQPYKVLLIHDDCAYYL